MADESVTTRFEVDASDFVRGTTRMERRLLRITAVADRTQSAISGIAKSLMLPASVVGVGVGAVGTRIVQLAADAQSAERAITSLLISAGSRAGAAFADYDVAVKTSRALRQEFKRLAIESPVTSTAIQEAFGLITFGATGAGATLAQQAQLARDVATRAQLQGLDVGVVGRDVSKLMRGELADVDTAVLFPIREEIAKLARAGDSAGALKLISDALGLSKRELEDFGASFGGQLATLQDRLTTLAERIGGPVIGALSERIQEFLRYLDESPEKVDDIVRRISDGMIGAIDTAVGAVKFLAEQWDTVVTVVKTLGVVWVGSVLTGAITRAITLAGQLRGALAGAGAAGGLARGLGMAGGVGMILGGTYLAASGVADAVLEQQSQALNARMGSTMVHPSQARAMFGVGPAGGTAAGTATGGEAGQLLGASGGVEQDRNQRGGRGRARVRELHVERVVMPDSAEFGRLVSPFLQRAALGATTAVRAPGVSLGVAR